MVRLKLRKGFLSIKDKVADFPRVLVVVKFGFEGTICKSVVKNKLPVLQMKGSIITTAFPFGIELTFDSLYLFNFQGHFLLR